MQHLKRDERSILVLDEDPELLVMLRCVLRDEGYEPALLCLQPNQRVRLADVRPDAVIAGLPAWPESRARLLCLLTHRLELRGVPLILLASDPDVAAPLTEAGAVNVIATLAKPFDLDDLFAQLDRALASPGLSAPRVGTGSTASVQRA